MSVAQPSFKLADQLEPPAFDLTSLPEVMIPAQLGAVLDKSTDQLATDRYNGCGPAFVKYGSKVYYLRSDVIAFLMANRRTKTGER
jgi:hypothetical protein